MKRSMLALISPPLLVPTPASAWNARGHMAVAAVAWKAMTPAARARAIQLIRLNPNYQKWIAGVPSANRDAVAFARAATWPDEIRSAPGYHNAGYTPPPEITGRNIGYADKMVHPGWHFRDQPIVEGGVSGEDPFPFNAVSRIQDFSVTLESPGASDDIQSYDLVWLMLLIGDIHQPLHATSRFNPAFPHGDNGGNGVKVCSEQAQTCDVAHSSALHSLWDGAVGTSKVPSSAIRFAGRLQTSSQNEASISDPNVWDSESFELAKNRCLRGADRPWERAVSSHAELSGQGGLDCGTADSFGRCTPSQSLKFTARRLVAACKRCDEHPNWYQSI